MGAAARQPGGDRATERCRLDRGRGQQPVRPRARKAGGEIDHIVYCPHHPDDGCECRKPAPGLLHQLAAHYGIALAGVPVVGDSRRDLEAARAVGARPILVRTGNGRQTEAAGKAGDAEVYDDLSAAAEVLAGEG